MYKALSHLMITGGLLVSFLLGSLLCASTASIADTDIDLPVLGDSGAGLMSPVQEKALGQAWLRSFRASVELETDPLLYEYIEDLLFELASHSGLEDKQLDLVIAKNATINAFAVPGGIVGVHTGLILQSGSEAQLASVLTHELAHLSQRHFARSVEAARRANFASIAGALAGIILASTAGGDAATAAIATTQALALDSRLRYSRLHENEADRIGSKTLVASGYDAKAAAEMFKQMQNAARLYGNRIPEFLRTHPITESRIADAENRARQVESRGLRDRIDFQLMKARVYITAQENNSDSIKYFKRILDNNQAFNLKKTNSVENSEAEELSKNHINVSLDDAARYGLALAYNESRNWKKARKTLKPLLNQMPGRIPYSLLDIEIDLAAGKHQLAEKRLRDLYSITPNHYAIGMLLAETLMHNKHFAQSQQVLEQLAASRPKQADIWYLLAEAQGLNGDILSLHQSRAEFFWLRGNLRQAKKHLGQALKIAGNNYQTSARIKQKLREMAQQEALLKKL